MKKVLLALIIAVALSPVTVLSQGGSSGVGPSVQQMTILPLSVAARTNSHIAPFNKISVSLGAEVLWDNRSGSDVRLSFGKGTNCKLIAGKSQVPHEIDSLTRCYVIQKISQGKEISVRFMDAGQYDYVVEFLGTDRKAEVGSVTVY